MIHLSEPDGFAIYTGDTCDVTAKETSREAFVADCSFTCSQNAQCFYFGFSHALQKCSVFESCPVLVDNFFVLYQKKGWFFVTQNTSIRRNKLSLLSAPAVDIT